MTHLLYCGGVNTFGMGEASHFKSCHSFHAWWVYQCVLFSLIANPAVGCICY